MNKWNKKDTINMIILMISLLFIIIFTFKFKYLYGSTIDWAYQHYKIPEYFRTLFYETGDLIPSFAFNLGGGQNIFNMSYYGLLSPITFISYLLPFMNMQTFIQIISIIGVIASTFLFYKWIRNHFDSNVSLVTSFIFMCAGPLIFHSHRHVMFINYMPFLLLTLICLDKYFDKGNKGLFILNLFLTIMTSYFFGVGSVLCIFVYIVYNYLKTCDKFKIKEFFKKNYKAFIYVFIAITLSSILLVPTLYTLLNGRSDTTVSYNIWKLFIPNINFNYFIYNAYSIGLTSIAVFSLVENMFSRKKERVFLSIGFLLLVSFPIFVYILNGTMYLNPKAFIPLLPLYCLMIAYSAKSVLDNKYSFKVVIAITSLLILLYCSSTEKIVFFLDYAIVLVSLVLTHVFNKKYLFIIPMILISLGASLITNSKDEYYEYDDLDNAEIQQVLFNDVFENDDSYYRIQDQSETLLNSNKIYDIKQLSTSTYSSVSSSYYKDFYYNQIGNEVIHRSTGQMSHTNNILFDIYMGVKYTITDNPLIGYDLNSELNEYKMYNNNDVLPLGYSSNKVLTKSYYDKLVYPYNAEALLNYQIVTDNNVTSSEYKSKIEKYNLELSNFSNKIDYKEENGTYIFEVKEDTTFNINLKNKVYNKILFLKFDMKYAEKCAVGDTSVTINGIKNTLTCSSWKYQNKNSSFEYSISSNNTISNLTINISKGKYIISNLESYTLEYKYIEEIRNNISEFIIDRNKTKGDVIIGSINSKEDGYFSMSIPYDKGFEIYVDNKKVELLNIDNSFIGFYLEKGNHDIKISYTSPGLNIGKILSIIGLLSYVTVVGLDKKKKKQLK